MRLRLAVIILTGLMALSVRGEYVTAVDGLRLRSEPNTESEILGVLPYGTEVTGKVRKGWMKTDDGYMSAEFLSDQDPLEGIQCLGTWRITAYYATGCATASGVYPEVNVTAAHNSLPFGTQLYIEGLGFWTVQDRGPGYLGADWMDLYLEDYGTCVQFGEHYANVYLIENAE